MGTSVRPNGHRIEFDRAPWSGRPDRRPTFTAPDGRTVTWPDGRTEDVEILLVATGTGQTWADSPRSAPCSPVATRSRWAGCLSTTHPGLSYVGLEWQHTPSSASLCGASRDARHVVR